MIWRIAWAKRLGPHSSGSVGLPPVEYLEEIRKNLQEQIRRAKAAERG